MLFIRCLILCCLSLVSMNSWALGKLGHQLVCQLTFDKLTTSEKNKINTLLAQLPADQQKQINRYNHRKYNEPITFAKACTWPDAIKDLAEYKKYSSWHYLNVRRDSDKIATDTCRQECVLTAIKFHQQQLNNSQGWKQLEALMFLGHWLGDIHQPLHVSYSDDKGGNLTPIKAAGKCKNLHWYWDECLLTADKKSFNQHMTALNQIWQNNTIKLWQESKVEDWATESLSILRQASFNYCLLEQKRCEKNNATAILDKSYQDEYQPVLYRRIVQAAARLQVIIQQANLP